MKSINLYILLFAIIPMLFSSCEKDGDMVTLSDVQPGELIVSDNNVILSDANSGSYVFSVAWNTKQLEINHAEKYGLATTALTNTVQFDTVSTFTNPKESVETATSKSFTGSSLNSFVLSMGLAPGKAQKIYVRLKSSIGANEDLLYSKISSFTVTPYDVIAFLYMPGMVNWSDFSVKLCSPNSNGKYEGYVEAAQWANFKFSTTASTTAGTVYGSLANSLYTLDAGTSQWNIWFDEGGYFLLNANTNNLTWSKTKITSFSIAGDFNGWSTTANPMTYDAVNKVWTATCNFKGGEWGNNFKIIANNAWDIVYGDSSGKGILKPGESTAAPTGTYTVTMDLSHPEKYTYTIK